MSLWDEGNRFLAGVGNAMGNMWRPQPKTVSQAQRQNGLGMDFYPKGSGTQTIPTPHDAFKSKYTTWLDASRDANATVDAAKVEYSTRLIRIPQNETYSGVNPTFLGVPQTGMVKFAASDQYKIAGYAMNDSTQQSSGWISAVATIKVLDSSQYTGVGQRARAAQYNPDDPLY